MNASDLLLEFRQSWRLELDSRDNLTTSRSIVSASTGDAVSQVAEAVSNASVAPILRSLERIGRILQVGIDPAVEDIEEIRSERESQPLRNREDLADAQLFAWLSRATVITVVRLGIGVLPGGRICPRGRVEEERGAGIAAVVVEVMQEELLARDTIRPNCVTKRHRS